VIFCLSVSDTEGRVILDDDRHGDTLALIEAQTWIEARQEAPSLPAMDPFDYRPGLGWVRRKSCDAGRPS
jgi:hypothetical protein